MGEIEVYQIRRQDAETGAGEWLSSTNNRSGYYKTLPGARIARGLFKRGWSWCDRGQNIEYVIYKVIAYADAEGMLHLGREQVKV